MFCEKCGSPIGDGDVFCGECGARVDESDTAIPELSNHQELPTDESEPLLESDTLPNEEKGAADDTSPEVEDHAQSETLCENCGVPLGDGELFCQSGGANISARISCSPEHFEDSLAENDELSEEPVSIPGATKRKNSKLWSIASILLLLIIIVGSLAAGCYYYSFYNVRNRDNYKPRDDNSYDARDDDSENIYLEQAIPFEIESEAIFESAEDQSLREQGLRWSAADSNGYSFLAASDPTHIFSSPPSFSARTAGNSVNLRSDANSASQVTNQLNKGEFIDIVQRYSSASDEYPWYRIQLAGQERWIYGGDIEF